MIKPLELLVFGGILVTIIVVVLSVSMQSTPVNKRIFDGGLIHDPSFEMGELGNISNWSETGIELNKWYGVDKKNDTYVIFADLVTEEDGNQVIRVVDQADCASFCSSEALQIVPAEAGYEYELSAVARRIWGEGGSLYLDFLNQDKSRINVKTVGGITEQWGEVSVSGVAPSGTMYIRVILYSDNKSKGEVWWDNVRLVPTGQNVVNQPDPEDQFAPLW